MGVGEIHMSWRKMPVQNAGANKYNHLVLHPLQQLPTYVLQFKVLAKIHLFSQLLSTAVLL